MQLTEMQNRIVLGIGTHERSTWGIANEYGLPTSKCLRIMKQLELLGLVEKCSRYSSKNNYVWKLTDAGKAGAACR
jgi:hypothetical protein